MNLSEVRETANKFRIDIIIIALCIAMGYCFAVKPKVDPVTAPKKISSTTEKVRPKEAAQPEKPASAPAPYQNIEGRNIFLPTGGYELPQPPGMVIPEKPYELVATLRGSEKLAVFRDFTGSLVARKPGEKLADGSEIVQVNDRTVTLRKGDTQKEFKIFHVNPKPAHRIVETTPPRPPSPRATPPR